MKDIDVSVIIPCHNYAHFLSESVSSALNQETVNVEVIVVDDGSTDNIHSVISRFSDPRVRFVHQEQAGIGAARNTGVRWARGSLLAFLDADDLWRVNRLARAAATIATSDQDTICFAMVQEFLDPSIDTTRGQLPELRNVPGVSASSCVVKSAVFRRVGSFSESLESGEFIDWYIRAQNAGCITHVDPDTLTFRRIHSLNRDRGRRESSKEYARILMRKIRDEQQK